MHTVFALLCFVVVIHWLISPYPSGLLHWHCGNLTIAPVPAKQPWWIWINTSCEFIMNDCITTTKQSTTKPCAYFLGYTVYPCQDVLYSLNGKTSYRQISYSIEATRLDVVMIAPLWNLTGISAALLGYLSNCRAIGKVWNRIARLRKLKESCGKTSVRLMYLWVTSIVDALFR